jgi:hypothetical protein
MTTDNIFNNLTCNTLNDYQITITAQPDADSDGILDAIERGGADVAHLDDDLHVLRICQIGVEAVP